MHFGTVQVRNSSAFDHLGLNALTHTLEALSSRLVLDWYIHVSEANNHFYVSKQIPWPDGLLLTFRKQPTILPNDVSVSLDPPLSPSEVQGLTQPRHRL
jgi:hypothetical protein